MVSQFRNPRLDPRQWSTDGYWSLESYDDAFGRTPCCGQAFFTRLLSEHPELRDDLHFLRWSVQSEHVYAFVDRVEDGFGVQFDPYLEYIIVFDGDGTNNEIGDWFENQVQEAIDYITLTYLWRKLL
jgi:hypothetical protein